MKKVIRLTEGDLHRIVKESVNRILNEMSPEVYLNYQKGRTNQANQARANGDYDTESPYYNRYRPCITLSSSVKITGGNGSFNSPFEISL